MSTRPAKPPAQHEPGTYEIRLRGHLDALWAVRLDVPSLSHEAGGSTVLRGIAADQAALHGLLRRISDLGLPLISVIHVNPDQSRLPTKSGEKK